MKQPVLNELTRLSLAERIQLVEDLWDGIANESGALLLADRQKQALDARLAAHAAEPDRGEDWDKLKQRLTSPS